MPDRYEREIDEILRKIEDFLPEGGRPRPQVRKVSGGLSSAQTKFARFLSSISLNQVMLWSLLAFLAAFFLRGIPGAGWVMIGALIVFVTAFVLTLRTPGARTPEKRWRGQPVHYSTGPNWPTRLKSWIKGRKKA